MIKNGIAGSWESFFVNYLITLYFGFGSPSPWPFSCLSIVSKHISFFSFSPTFVFFSIMFFFLWKEIGCLSLRHTSNYLPFKSGRGKMVSPVNFDLYFPKVSDFRNFPYNHFPCMNIWFLRWKKSPFVS